MGTRKVQSAGSTGSEAARSACECAPLRRSAFGVPSSTVTLRGSSPAGGRGALHLRQKKGGEKAVSPTASSVPTSCSHGDWPCVPALGLSTLVPPAISGTSLHQSCGNSRRRTSLPTPLINPLSGLRVSVPTQGFRMSHRRRASVGVDWFELQATRTPWAEQELLPPPRP